MKIALVVGHASDKQGAVGSLGISEYNFWLDFVQDLKDKLARLEHLADIEFKVFERPTSKRGYTSRMKALHAELDAWGSDVAVSFHFNASASRAQGHEVLYCSRMGRVLADRMNNLFNEYLPNRDRGIKKKTKKDRGGGFLCRGRSVCILVEPFFASEQDYFVEEGYHDLMDAFLAFFERI